MSVALNAVNRQVDLQRLTVPVSGTAVRNAPYENRHYLNPVVYRDLVTKVVFLGAPSTGKTTLAESMARHYRTAWMPEYGREYWEQNQIDRRLTLEQLEEIATGHLEREEKQLQEARDVLFVDTNAITTYMFSLYYHGETTQELARLAREAETRYGLVFLCDADIPYDDTWDRSGEVQREEFQLAIMDDLRERGVPFQILRGTLREREEQVAEALKRLDPL